MSDFYPRGNRFGWVQADPPCPAPTLTVQAIDSVNGIVTLAWSGGAPACGSAIFQGTSPGQESLLVPVAIIVEGVTTAQITGLPIGQTYYFVLKSIGCNNQGYGCSSNEVSASVLLMASYAGFAPNTSPTAAQILALEQYNTGTFAGTYVLEQNSGSAGYPCFWFPIAFGLPNIFMFAQFPYGMNSQSLTVNGIPGTVYLLPFLQHSLSETWTVS